jgi:tetratricopeptide (TPR) repeat protein
MSKRNRARRAASTTAIVSPSAPPLPVPGPDMLRRGLLVLLTAVIVARPLVWGEDPGLVSDFANPGGMTLTLLAFLGCAGWAGWRLWARQPALHIGPFEALLFILTVLLFIGTASAAYFRAAWLASWEWLGLLLTVFLVRQLAVRPDEQRGLMAVLLAGAIALSAQGLYQAVWEIPATVRATNDRPEEYLDKQLEVRQIQATPLERYELLQRLEHRQVHGPFFHSASLAACLALFLPMLAGAVIAVRRGHSPGWLRTMTWVFAGVVLLVLVLTGCWSAVAAVGVVGLFVLTLRWSALHGGRMVYLALAAITAIVGGYLLVKSGALAPELKHWGDVWPVSWQLIEERGLQGVGLSQFGFFYPRYMEATSGANESNPSSAVLELWAEGGLAVLIVFVVAVAVYFRAVRRWWKASVAPAEWRAGGVSPLLESKTGEHPHQQGADAPRSPSFDVTESAPVRWEYYVGGMIGIILAFLLRAFNLPPEDLLREAIAAAVQSVAWFAAVAIYERIEWSPSERVASLTAGISAVMLVLLVNAGIGFPSVAGLFWISLALVLAIVTPRPVEWLSRHQVAYVLPLPVLGAAAFCYFTFVFYPPSAGVHADRRACQFAEVFHEQMNKAPEEREMHNPVEFVTWGIIVPVYRAEKEDYANTRLRVMLANWYGELARLRDQKNLKPKNDFDLALSWAKVARDTNPEGREGYEVEYNIYMRLARVFRADAERQEKEAPNPKKMPAATREQVIRTNRLLAQRHFAKAAEALQKYIPRDPTNPNLHFHMAYALYSAGNTEAGRKEADDAFDLDRRAGTPRKLTDQQREQLAEWLRQDSKR